MPFYEHRGERPTLTKWAEKRGKTGIEEYWQEKNVLSLNGVNTGISAGSYNNGGLSCPFQTTLQMRTAAGKKIEQ